VNYTVIIPKTVQKQIDRLAEVERRRVLQRLSQLEINPRPIGCVKLVGYANEYRVRIGDHRIRYEIDDEGRIVILLVVKHRRDVYRE
jgi:mRNA interferase RelE/StbE